jgi:iron complex transport system ATP-binding protein
MAGEYVISIQGLGCKHGQHFVLKDLDWQVRCGQNWLLFGRNGSGKTTLLGILAGFLPYQKGKLEVFGKMYGEETHHELQQQIGICSSSLFARFYHRETALEIVLSGRTGGLGIDAPVLSSDIRKIKAFFRYFNILPVLNMPFYMLSKGESQCVLLIRALMGDPQLLILDEPFAGLDMVCKMRFSAILNQVLTDPDITVILVSHQPEEINPLLDHALLIKKGRPLAAGPIENVFNSANLSVLFQEDVCVRRDRGSFIVEVKDRGYLPKWHADRHAL